MNVRGFEKFWPTIRPGDPEGSSGGRKKGVKNSPFKQVELMLQTIPHVAAETGFALKGGTAINLFVHDLFDNRLIFGDNLLALKALEQEFTGKIKCIYIDPPFNTGSAFEHYDDGLEHSTWLAMMRDRLDCLRKLLAPDGLVFVQIDYREGARLKVLMDEVFGNLCFKNEIIVRRGTKNVQSQFETIDALSTGHDTVYLYAKAGEVGLRKLQALDEETEPGKWDTFWRGTDRPTMRYEIFAIKPDTGQWRWSEERAYKAKRNYERYREEHSASLTLDEYYGLKKQESGVGLDFVRLGPDNTVQYYVSPRNYKILSDVWMDLRTSGKSTDFAHEKHEELLERIIRWSTNLGDWILDSFGWSGTTGAVAHKMGRPWIMVELGEHCHTHIIPRLKKSSMEKTRRHHGCRRMDGRRRVPLLPPCAVST